MFALTTGEYCVTAKRWLIVLIGAPWFERWSHQTYGKELWRYQSLSLWNNSPCSSKTIQWTYKKQQQYGCVQLKLFFPLRILLSWQPVKTSCKKMRKMTLTALSTPPRSGKIWQRASLWLLWQNSKWIHQKFFLESYLCQFYLFLMTPFLTFFHLDFQCLQVFSNWPSVAQMCSRHLALQDEMFPSLLSEV